MPSSGGFEAAVARIRAAGLVAYPTETVYGLGADATSAEAVARLRAWKGRDDGRPISILVDAPEALDRMGLGTSPPVRRLVARFWPGPLTLVLPAAPGRFAPGIARPDGAVGVRCSPDPTAAGLARTVAAAGIGPLTATSLNRSGEPPVRDARAAAALCAQHPGPLLVAPATGPVSCGATSDRAPSTVVDCSDGACAVLREGAVTAAAIARALEPGETSSP